MRRVNDLHERLKATLVGILNSTEEANWVLCGVEAEKLRMLYRGKPRPLALVSFDVDRIKDFVFSSVKLLEISGASEMVKDLTCPPQNGVEAPHCSVYRILEDQHLSADNVVFAGGGTGMLVVPADMAEILAKEISDRFAGAVKTGSCTTIWRAFHPHELILGPDIAAGDSFFPGVKLPVGASGFGSVMRLMADELREKKEEKMVPAIFSLPGYVARCASCGIRPALKRDKLSWDDELLCESCFTQRKRGRDTKTDLSGQLLEMAQSINDILREDAERGYVGVIHADADQMGRKLMQMQTLDDMAIFSSTVTRVIEDIRVHLVSKHELSRQYQAPIVGGDDILLIVPAHKTPVIVADLLTAVRQDFTYWSSLLAPDKEKLSEIFKSITMSVGFVIVPSHYQIRFSVDYAENLLAQAKKGSHEGAGEHVDFAVISDGTPLHAEISTLRQQFYTRRSEKWCLSLTARPLKASRFRALLEKIEVLKSAMAKNQLKLLENLLFGETPEAARINILYQWVRMDSWWEDIFGRDHKKMEEWLKEFLLKEGDARNGIRSYNSAITELVELYDFVEVGT